MVVKVGVPHNAGYFLTAPTLRHIGGNTHNACPRIRPFRPSMQTLLRTVNTQCPVIPYPLVFCAHTPEVWALLSVWETTLAEFWFHPSISANVLLLSKSADFGAIKVRNKQVTPWTFGNFSDTSAERVASSTSSGVLQPVKREGGGGGGETGN
jgi:hypothetical protein